jgi:two-component system, NtrC family, sensor kinase
MNLLDRLKTGDESLMPPSSAESSAAAAANTPLAAWRAALSLRVRLALLVAIVVAAVISIEAFLEIRMFERGGQKDLLDAASATAEAVADELELRRAPHTQADVHAILHEFLVASPTVRDIAAFMKDGDNLTLLGRTSAGLPDDVLPLARQAMEARQPITTSQGRLRIIAAPVVRDSQAIGAVTVTTSFASLEQLSVRGRQVTVWFALPAIIVLTLLVDLLARRLVHRPIAAIRETMERAGAGEIGVRAPIDRPDEMGAVAEGLNRMLESIEHFHADLRARIDEATAGLRERNAELVESYQRVLTLREALARTEQMAALGQMAANMAHQIGTPLNLISGYVQLMIQDARASGYSLQRLETIQIQIARVVSAVRATMDYARRPGLQRQSIDLSVLVEQVSEISRPALRAANVDLRQTVDNMLPRIQADPVQLELALLNLVSNALDAMPGGGRLEIAAARQADGVRLTVSDNGTGIPAEVLPRVFEPWVTTKPAGRGTGLGLSITREVVVSHGGSIGVRSDPERGTVFTIDLPSEAPASRESDAACNASS